MRNKRFVKIIGLLCSAALAVAVPAVASAASIKTVNMAGQKSVRSDLDGDGRQDDITVAQRAGSTWLDISYGHGGVVSCSLGASQSIELVKIGSVDLDEDGKADIILVSRNTETGEYHMAALLISSSEYTLLSMPNPDSDLCYKMTATFSRNFIMEIRNAAGDFLITVKLPDLVFRPLYRSDGTAPETLRAQVSRFQDFSIARFGSGYAIELWQYIRSSALSAPIGAVVSTIIWRDGQFKLVNQRYQVQ